MRTHIQIVAHRVHNLFRKMNFEIGKKYNAQAIVNTFDECLNIFPKDVKFKNGNNPIPSGYGTGMELFSLAKPLIMNPSLCDKYFGSAYWYGGHHNTIWDDDQRLTEGELHDTIVKYLKHINHALVVFEDDYFRLRPQDHKLVVITTDNDNDDYFVEMPKSMQFLWANDEDFYVPYSCRPITGR